MEDNDDPKNDDQYVNRVAESNVLWKELALTKQPLEENDYSDDVDHHTNGHNPTCNDKFRKHRFFSPLFLLYRAQT